MKISETWTILKPYFLLLLGIVSLEILFIVTAPESLSGISPSLQGSKQTILPEPYLWNGRQLSTDDFTYNNPKDTYSPSQYVQYGHKFTGMDFKVTMAYGERLLYAPIITFGLGFLAIFLTHFGLLCRCCFDCCRCLPNLESVNYERDRFCLTVFYFVLALLVLIIDQLVFLGNQSIDTGVKDFRSDINTLNHYIDLMTTDSNDLNSYASSLSTEYTAARNSCAAVKLGGDYSSQINSFQSDMSSLSSSLSSVNDKISLVQDYTNTYAIFYRTLALYIIWGLAIVCILFFFISKFCESVGFTKFSIFLATITFLLYLILGVPWLLVTSAGGDLCMKPTYNIVKAIPIETVKNITLYYATCQGTSVLQTYVNQGLNSLDQLNSSIKAAEQACPHDKNVQAMQTTLNEIGYSTDDIESLMSCPPLQYLLLDVINNAFCTNFYQGIFYIWGSQLITSFLLFLLILTSVFLYQYYEMGKVVPQDDMDEEDEEAGPDSEKGKVVAAQVHHHEEI